MHKLGIGLGLKQVEFQSRSNFIRTKRLQTYTKKVGKNVVLKMFIT